MKKLGIPLLIGLTLLIGGRPGTALGQQSSASDVSGVSTTGSTIAGGVFTPTPGTVAVAASPAVAVAVATATTTVTSQLSAGTMASPTGAAIPASVQVTVLAVLSGSAPTSAVVDALGAGGAPAQASSLADALTGLASSPTPGQLATAVGHYNDLVLTSDPGFLSNPPAEFLAVNAVLSQMIAAAQLAQ